MDIDHSSIKRILILRYRSIGDIVLSFPTVEALRLTYPNARIDMLVDDVFADICYGNPHLNGLILHKRKDDSLKGFAKTWAEIKFAYGIRKNHYDLVVDLHCGPRSATLAWLSGARYRIGSKLRLRNRIFYNIFPEPATKPHTVEAMLSIIAPLNPKLPEKKQLFLDYRKEDMDYIRGFLKKFDIHENDHLVLLHPGARVDFKKLPAVKMGELVSWMTDEFGVKVVVAGADADIQEISEIAAASGRPCLMATNLTLGQLAALIDSAELFIGNDSGPMHMAAALKVPIIAFFGPSDPLIWAPWRAKGKIVRCPKMECMPCDQKGCKEIPNHCMARIRTGDIMTAVKSMLEAQHQQATNG